MTMKMTRRLFFDHQKFQAGFTDSWVFYSMRSLLRKSPVSWIPCSIGTLSQEQLAPCQLLLQVFLVLLPPPRLTWTWINVTAKSDLIFGAKCMLTNFKKYIQHI